VVQLLLFNQRRIDIPFRAAFTQCANVLLCVLICFSSGIRDNYTFRTRKQWKVAFLRLLPGGVHYSRTVPSRKCLRSHSKWDARRAINVNHNILLLANGAREDFSSIALLNQAIFEEFVAISRFSPRYLLIIQ